MPDLVHKLLLDINEVSALTGVSVGTLYHWVSQKRVPFVRLSARCLRFRRSDLDAWIAALGEHTTSRAAIKPRHEPRVARGDQRKQESPTVAGKRADNAPRAKIPQVRRNGEMDGSE